ncbi:hypothetical protein MBLNU457_1876t1 [Dothideomycetes sp. NU457]
MNIPNSMRQRALPTTTIRQDEAYDWTHFDEDPDDLFASVETLRTKVAQNTDYLVETLAHVVYGSNFIEKAGSSKDVTLEISNKIFRGEELAEEADEELPQDVREVIQHCRAFSHHIAETVVQDKPLSEALILATHKILTYKVRSSDGDSHETYGGQYRTESVSAGMHTFTPPQQVPVEMRRMINEYNADIAAAAASNSLDPFVLAAKYCHKFVNIHPFADGNGRTCRIILNAILLKYAGIVVPLGENDDEREEYLGVAGRSSMSEAGRDEEMEEVCGAAPPWGELAYLTLLCAKRNLVEWAEKIGD